MLDELSAALASVRHGVLQNGAAIDFLLLAHSHSCEKFQGMCCINLSNHFVLIHEQISELHQLATQLQKKEDGLNLEGWLKLLHLKSWLVLFV